MSGKKNNISNKKNNEKITSIKKTPAKTLSKKKQRSLTKSVKVMIEKMDNHTTDDDILNIMMSMETNTDTKEIVDGNESDAESKKEHGLSSLKVEKLQQDRANDAKTEEKHKKVQSDIAEQLKLIDSFTL